MRLRTPPPSLPEPRKPSSIEKRPFLRGSCRLFSTFPVSADNNGLSGGFSTSSLCTQKFRSRRQGFREPVGNRLLRKELRAASENLLGIQSERFELSAPFRANVAEPLDTNAARQTTFDRGSD